MAARPGGHSAFPIATERASPVRSLFPILVVGAAAVVTLVAKLRERRLWASRRLSGGRKALVLNLYQRD